MIYTSECGRYTIEENEHGKFYFKDGKYHRDGDLPAMELADGTKVNAIEMEIYQL